MKHFHRWTLLKPTICLQQILESKTADYHLVQFSAFNQNKQVTFKDNLGSVPDRKKRKKEKKVMSRSKSKMKVLFSGNSN